jgi:uncharacterized protein YigE (DUF2233 family)
MPSSTKGLTKKNIYQTLTCLILLSTAILLSSTITNADSLESAIGKLTWEKVETGLYKSSYIIPEKNFIVKPEILLIRFDLNHFTTQIAVASDFGEQRSDIKTLTEKSGGIFGINASFFDPKGAPLGLLVVNGRQVQRVHKGGNLLTGIFLIQDSYPKIIHRNDFDLSNITQALQAGPRLIVNGAPLKVSSSTILSRRSGIAITQTGEVIYYATTLRFPGANFEQLQNMLLLPELGITDALNLDGGSSSQLYLKTNKSTPEILISGGESIPVGLIVKRKISK